MLVLKSILTCCGVAVAIALIVDVAFLVISRINGSWMGDFATRSGWVTIFALIWISAFVAGIFLARAFHLFPFLPIKR